MLRCAIGSSTIERANRAGSFANPRQISRYRSAIWRWHNFLCSHCPTAKTEPRFRGGKSCSGDRSAARRGPALRLAADGARRRDRRRGHQLTALSTGDVDGHRRAAVSFSAARPLEAILSVTLLDTFVPDPAGRMEVVGDPDAIPPVQREVQQVLDRAAGRHVPLQGIGALRLLRAGKKRLRHPHHRRTPLLWRLHLQEGSRAAGVRRAARLAHAVIASEGIVIAWRL